jgi:hypothetical protein
MIGVILRVMPTSKKHMKNNKQAVATIVHLARLDISSGSRAVRLRARAAAATLSAICCSAAATFRRFFRALCWLLARELDGPAAASLGATSTLDSMSAPRQHPGCGTWRPYLGWKMIMALVDRLDLEQRTRSLPGQKFRILITLRDWREIKFVSRRVYITWMI